jgi:hypothetical protein
MLSDIIQFLIIEIQTYNYFSPFQEDDIAACIIAKLPLKSEFI